MAPSRRSRRVLFVEDDRAAREAYISYLAGIGYDVRPADDGQQALTLANAWMPDVIVLDLGLPDIDGWEVAQRLKAAPQTASIPIVALTGADLPHERVTAMAAICACHLTKPCEPTDLVDAIEAT